MFYVKCRDEILTHTKNEAYAWYLIYKRVFSSQDECELIRIEPNSNLERLRNGISIKFKWRYLQEISEELECTAIEAVRVLLLKSLIERLLDVRETPVLPLFDKKLIIGKQASLIQKLALKTFKNKKSTNYVDFFKETANIDLVYINDSVFGAISTDRGIIKF